jgi:chromosomal replication initiation ATPase DnaA
MKAGAIYEWDFKRPTREAIMEAVCEEFMVTVEELRSDLRNRNLFNARSAYAYISRKYGETFQRIGIELNRDHSTVTHQVKKMEDFEFTKDPVIKQVRLIEQQLLITHI